ncbi:hypothetical protein D3H65_11670 [Paraflavitalea soli]|uniref:VCBS repeat-containing protein n=1 Tax=Paraflavitalea soli TaxID=2315862 RepID=A0A3B7MK86_9BACT|nr:hypothetical protein [Paraflavitalea soli]AXY74598.1 hypothetical protein D3H65_11670 [Paraflavitalea soli]
MQKSADLHIYEAILRPGEQSTGRVTHHYGPSVTIAEVYPDYVPMEPEELEQLKEGLDPVGQRGIAAFQLRQSEEFRKDCANRPHDGVAWNDKTIPGLQTPKRIDHKLYPDYTGTPTSSQMEGSVAVAIIIVSGPDALAFTPEEITTVDAKVQNGLSWLGVQTGTPVSFHFALPRKVELTVPDDPSKPKNDNYWLDPTMEQLGYATALDYVLAIREEMSTDWAYCAFFIKYSMEHFAYAMIGGPYLAMNYDNDGWKPVGIDRVFAHESSHIFGAPDEYDDCSCTKTYGYYHVVNGNCENCAPGGGVLCVMKRNSWEMCAYTPWHLGCIIPATVWNGPIGTYKESSHWLAADIDNDGRDELIQLWGPRWLGMVVYGWSSGRLELMWGGDMKEGSYADAWLTGDIDKDMQAEIIQVWDRDNNLYMIVYGWNGSGMEVSWSGNTNQEPAAIQWLTGYLDEDGKMKIIQLRDIDGQLEIVIYHWDGKGIAVLKAHQFAARNLNECHFIIGDINRDGKEEIIQTWNNNGHLGMVVYHWDGNDISILWSGDFIDETPNAISWLMGDLNDDRLEEIIQLRNNDGQLGIVIYQWNGQAIARLWSNDTINNDANAIQWLIGDVDEDDQMEIIQVQNNGGQLGLVAYGWSGSAITILPWGYHDMGQGSGSDGYLIGDVNGLGYQDIIQPWSSFSSTNMLIYGKVRD